ncbi:hypothetical protein SCLCIDRAFT_1207166 [Scleroderma citrinum Foug A]|uniref:DUF6534 domain-containing protein n=1 Tax=Scleroderma citrinum Foug A TaxID=1036808 RepID=A0A0C3AY61_9AGAM|nr:hypothetical protein SCLCIDRAFT_1207166 [Scleroderma citrinum Foug A]
MSSVPTIAGNCGSLLLGALVAFSLSGCVSLQFAMYWRTYSKDMWQIRSLITLTWMLDIAHSVFVAMGIWDSIIAPNGDFSPEQLDKIPWSLAISGEPAVLITFVAHSFSTYRIYILQRKWILAVLVGTLAFVRLVCASVTAQQMIYLGQYSLLVRPFPGWIITLGLSLSAFIDIVITVSLCHFFRESRKEKCSVTTHRILDTLTKWTLQNGLITCAGATASLICWKTIQDNLLFMGLHFVMGKLYANSLLASLNVREMIRKPCLHNTTGENSQVVILSQDFGMDPSENPVTNSTPSKGMKGRYPIQVNVEHSVVSMVDMNIDVPSDLNATSE